LEVKANFVIKINSDKDVIIFINFLSEKTNFFLDLADFKIAKVLKDVFYEMDFSKVNVFFYLRIIAKSFLISLNINVYVDSGIKRFIIGYSIFSYFFYIIKKR